jgi:CRISPR/Cas system-associated exonuclease Cas4 (RecB family)
MAKKETKKNVLSKSKLMKGIQCPKSLWLATYRSELEPVVDTATQMQFDEGNEVGELARKNEGEGVLIENDYWDYDGAHEATQASIKSGAKLIFEGSFMFEDYFSRADILKKTKSDWHLVEVKKSTQVKDYHIQDAAVQAFIIESSGTKLKTISIRHINNQCIFPDLEDLFSTADVTDQVRSIQKDISKQIKNLKAITSSAKEPKVKIGPHCANPFDCSFKDHCWQDVPEKSVFDLPSVFAKKKWALFESGSVKIADLDPAAFKGVARRAIEVTKKKKPFIDSKAIGLEISKWNWPLYFFDFETIGPAIPRYEDTAPYNQIPFQFSCHVWKSETSDKLEHFEYLHQKPTDPRADLIGAMLDGLGTKGSIVSYNKSFEISVIKKLAEFDSKNRTKLLALTDRFVDPLPIFKESVYHPEFLGSFSIKSVAPALLGQKLSYKHLAVGDGSTAQAWAEQILKGKIKGKDLEKIADDLLKYCRQDTMAMVELVRWLMTTKASA